MIFPRIYVIADSEPDPVTSGVVLMKSQSAAAAEEIEMKHPSSPTAGRLGPRSRAIRTRTKSISSNGRNDFYPSQTRQVFIKLVQASARWLGSCSPNYEESNMVLLLLFLSSKVWMSRHHL